MTYSWRKNQERCEARMFLVSLIKCISQRVFHRFPSDHFTSLKQRSCLKIQGQTQKSSDVSSFSQSNWLLGGFSRHFHIDREPTKRYQSWPEGPRWVSTMVPPKRNYVWWFKSGGVHNHGGTPSHHPCLFGIFLKKKHLFLGTPISGNLHLVLVS